MKIAIAGYGIEGEENYAYWSADPANDITIVDQKVVPDKPLPEGVVTLLGPGVFEQLNGFDLVIRTASLPPQNIKTDGKIWSATNEFFAKCPAPIIGVTGTKGKGTTASLIASILRAAGKKVWLVGNIGVPALGVLRDVTTEDIVVYELSSFQLWDSEKSPHTAVVLFIEQEHLDVHKDMEEYVHAKGNIARFQKSEDVVVYKADNKYAQSIAHASAAIKVGFPSEHTTHVRDGYFYNGHTKLCSIDALQIKGDHNVDNAVAAIDAVWNYTQNAPAIEAGLRSFSGLPHRLAYVATVRGVDYYDDSIATTPGSAIAALRAFPDKKKVIILGGSYKGSDFSELGAELCRHDATAILIGDEAKAIAAACDEQGFKAYEILENTTAELFTMRAAELASPGSVVLLSPSAASFGLFKNYADRGEQFISAVHSLTD